MLTFVIAGVTLGACAALRICLRDRAASGGNRVRFQPLWNRRGAFDLPLGRETLAVLSALVLACVWLCRRKSPVGAGLLLGGGLSNLWERLRQGAVFDYLRFPKAPGPLKRYVYNLADFAVLAGALALLMGKRR